MTNGPSLCPHLPSCRELACGRVPGEEETQLRGIPSRHLPRLRRLSPPSHCQSTNVSERYGAVRQRADPAAGGVGLLGARPLGPVLALNGVGVMPGAKLAPGRSALAKAGAPALPFGALLIPVTRVGTEDGCCSWLISKLKNPKPSAEAVRGGSPAPQASRRKVLILQGAVGSAQRGMSGGFLVLAGCQESLPARGSTAAPTDGVRDTISMVLQAWLSRATEICPGRSCREWGRGRGATQRSSLAVWGGEDLKRLLSMESTNCVFPL